nr:immunoglobulin delta heavy chain [Ictalurus punctatus]
MQDTFWILLMFTGAASAQHVTEPNITMSTNTMDNNVNLLCWLDGFSPKKISVAWYKGNMLHTEKTTMKIFENLNNGERTFGALSQLSINAQQWNEGTEFTCKATHNSKIFSQTWSKCKAEPTSKPLIRLEKPGLMSVLTDSEVTASCVVETVHNTKVSWFVDGREKTDRVTLKTLDGRTVSNLTISTNEWKNWQTVKCTAAHLCFGTVEKTINILEPVQKTPTVVIRRNLADILKGDSTVLECAARDLPSGELSVILHANGIRVLEPQYVDLPKGVDTLTARFTVPTTHRNKNQRFTCQIQQSRSKQWTSNSIENLFGDPSVELSAVSNTDNSGSITQKLICSGTGFNPQIKWLHKSVPNALTEVMMQGDGRVKVSSEILVQQQEWNIDCVCEVSDQDNPKHVQKSTRVCAAHSTVKPLIRLEKPGLMSVLTDSEVTASCVVETVLNSRVSWFVDGGEKTNRVTLKTLDGRTVSNLTISTDEWKNWQTIKCTAKHPCFDTVEKTINILEPVQKTPTVVIRRNLADILKGDSTVLECAARDLPSGELSVILHANGIRVLEPQYVDLPKGVDTLTARFTVSTTHRNKNQRFTCQIQQSRSKQWTSNSIENLFDDPSVELLVISSVDKSASATQKLLCAATGLNPKIKWLPESVVNALNGLSKVTVDSDGRVKVSSEISVPQQQWNNRVTFTCRVSDQDPLKPVEKSTSICAVTPDFAQKAQVYLLAPSISDMRANDHVSVTCLLLGHRLNDFSIVWKIGKDITSQGVTTQPLRVHSNGTESVRSVLKVPAAKWNAYKTVSCEVTHLCGTKKMEHTISKTRGSDRKSPTVRILSPSDDDLSGVRNTYLLCLVDGFRPADISVHWELNGSRLDASQFMNSPVGIRSAWSDYSMHSALILPASKREDGTFSCVVSHESSEKPIRNSINNIYASVNENAPSVELLQGQNKLVCLVYGYSPSAINITWLLNSVSVQHDDSTNSSAKRPDGKFSIKSHLKVQASEWAPGDTYTCHVEHITGIVTRDISKKEFTEETIYFDENKYEQLLTAPSRV